MTKRSIKIKFNKEDMTVTIGDVVNKIWPCKGHCQGGKCDAAWKTLCDLQGWSGGGNPVADDDNRLELKRALIEAQCDKGDERTAVEALVVGGLLYEGTYLARDWNQVGR